MQIGITFQKINLPKDKRILGKKKKAERFLYFGPEVILGT